MDSAD